jgi:1-deoxy-D-xylulose-5-phosphate reductoisomerase
MKGISILGSTGSIGIQALDIIRIHRDRFRVVALAAGSNIDLLEKQVREFRPAIVSCADAGAARELHARVSDLPGKTWIGQSTEGLERAATAEEAALVVGGLPGSTGLLPTFAAVESGKDVALATKEVLVMAGELFMNRVAERGIRLLPVDSEQSAIFQCLQGNGDSEINRIMLTASGGPFRDASIQDLQRVTREQALNHPRWKMGPKVTIDSATLMNKGLEVIEAKWLFGLTASQIEVVIHPESIVHSMVEFQDGSIIAQLGATDMRIPISYALAFPQRIASGTSPIDFPQLGSLTFHEPDAEKFPLLKAAFDSLKDRSTMPIILNAADEVAVGLFLAEKIPFHRIPRIVLEAMDRLDPAQVETLEEIQSFHESVVERVMKDWPLWIAPGGQPR